MKTCTKCKTEKNLEEFRSYQLYSDSYCKQCRSAYQKEYAKNHADKIKDYQYKHKYGMSLEEVVELKKECQTCGSKEKLCIDHCHKSGAVRGVLCHRCNRVLGQVGEDVSVLEAMVRYLNEN